MSRAIVVAAFGDPESFTIEEQGLEEPGPGEVRIAVRTAGVSYVDVLVASGLYQLKPPLPLIPGSEFAGVINAVGKGVSRSRIGQRVCVSAFGAAFAETAVVPSLSALQIPDSMPWAEAAVFRVSYATAHHALVQRAGLKAGETVLVLGAGGAVGFAAVQVGKALGAFVVGSASTGEKRTLAISGGADAVVDSRSPAWREDVKVANGGKPVDIVVDPVGGDATEVAFRSLAWGGRHLVIGFANGSIAKLPVNLALLKGAALVGVDVRQFGEREPDTVAANLQVLFDLYRSGKLKPAVTHRFAFEDFAAAMRLARAGETAGRIVLEMPSAGSKIT